MHVQRTVVPRARVVVDQVLRDAAGLDRLVAVDEGNHLHLLAVVVACLQTAPVVHDGIRAGDGCLVA